MLLSLYLENRDSSSLAAEGRMETMRSTCQSQVFIMTVIKTTTIVILLIMAFVVGKDNDKNDKKINLPPPEVSPGRSIREEGVAKKQRVGGGLKPP